MKNEKINMPTKEMILNEIKKQENSIFELDSIIANIDMAQQKAQVLISDVEKYLYASSANSESKKFIYLYYDKKTAITHSVMLEDYIHEIGEQVEQAIQIVEQLIEAGKQSKEES